MVPSADQERSVTPYLLPGSTRPGAPLAGSQRRNAGASLFPPEAIVWPPGDHATTFGAPRPKGIVANACSSSPQILIIPSWPPEATRLPSGDQATDATPLPCALRTAD